MSPFLRYSVLILFATFSFDVVSQNHSFNAGLLFNANGIQFEGEDTDYWSGSSGTIWGTGGLSVGAYVKRGFSDHIYASIELRYIRKGSLYEYFTDEGLREYENLKLNYIELPVLFGYTFRPYKKYRIFETGISISKLFSSELALNEFSQRIETPEASDFKDWDLSWIGSAKFPLNRKKGDNLLFGIRAEYSILSIHKYYNLHNFVYGIQIEFLL